MSTDPVAEVNVSSGHKGLLIGLLVSLVLIGVGALAAKKGHVFER